MKFVSALFAAVFLWTESVVALPSLQADGGMLHRQIHLPSFKIPENLAIVKETYGTFSKDEPLLIYIEDAHVNYEAQIRIKEILRWLRKEAGVNLALLEGASSRLDPDRFRFFPQEKYNRALADAMTRRGFVTGPELFLMEVDKDAYTARGIESAEQYKENLKTFRRVLKAKVKTGRFHDYLTGRLERLENRLLNPDLKNLLRSERAYRSGAHPVLTHLAVLRKGAKKQLKLDLTDPYSQIDWPQLVRLALMEDAGKEIDAGELIGETQAFMSRLKRLGISSHLINAVWAVTTGNDTSGLPRDLRSIFEHLYAEVKPKGLRFQDYPALNGKIASLIFKDELDPQALDQEMSRLRDHLFQALAKTDTERIILALEKDIALLGRAYRLELNPQEFAHFLERFEAIKPEAILHRIAAAAAREAPVRSAEQEDKATSLTRMLGEVRRFYLGTQARDRAFTQNIFSALKEHRARKAVIVTGGFHTSRMTRMLREQNASFIVLTPRLTQVDTARNRSLYYEVMTGRVRTRFDRSEIIYPRLEAVGVEVPDRTRVTRVQHEEIGFLAAGNLSGGDMFRDYNPSSLAGESYPDPAIPLAAGLSRAGFGADAGPQPTASALDHFFSALPEGTPRTLETLKQYIPSVPDPLNEASVLRTLLGHGKKPERLSWNDFVKLLALADSGYEPISGQGIERTASALDHLADTFEGSHKSASSYLSRFRDQLNKLAQGYQEHPAAIKRFRAQDSEDAILKELRYAQILDRLGIGPHFYGIVRSEETALPVAYAMQIGVGYSQEDRSEIVRRLLQVGLLSPSDWMIGKSGYLFIIDAGGINDPLSEKFQHRFDAFVESLKNSRSPLGRSTGALLPGRPVGIGVSSGFGSSKIEFVRWGRWARRILRMVGRATLGAVVTVASGGCGISLFPMPANGSSETEPPIPAPASNPPVTPDGAYIYTSIDALRADFPILPQLPFPERGEERIVTDEDGNEIREVFSPIGVRGPTYFVLILGEKIAVAITGTGYYRIRQDGSREASERVSRVWFRFDPHKAPAYFDEEDVRFEGRKIFRITRILFNDKGNLVVWFYFGEDDQGMPIGHRLVIDSRTGEVIPEETEVDVLLSPAGFGANIVSLPPTGSFAVMNRPASVTAAAWSRFGGVGESEALQAVLGMAREVTKHVMPVEFDAGLAEKMLEIIAPKPSSVTAEKARAVSEMLRRVDMDQIVGVALAGNEKALKALRILDADAGIAMALRSAAPGIIDSRRDTLLVAEGEIHEHSRALLRAQRALVGNNPHRIAYLPRLVTPVAIEKLMQARGNIPVAAVLTERTRFFGKSFKAYPVVQVSRASLAAEDDAAAEELESLLAVALDKLVYMQAEAIASGQDALLYEIRDRFAFKLDATGRIWTIGKRDLFNVLEALAHDARMQQVLVGTAA